MFKIVERSLIWVSVWLLVMILWIVSFFMNLNLSISFTWWVEMVIDTANSDSEIILSVEWYLQEHWLWESEVSLWVNEWYKDVFVKFPFEESNLKDVSSWLKNKLIEDWVVNNEDDILELSVIWPSVGDYMKSSAIKAIFFWLALISIYILFAFAWIRQFLSPVALWVITIFTMIFDISVTAWFYGFLMMINESIKVDLIFVISILTVMWYSINDTIIIFDRVRENVSNNKEKLDKHEMDFEELLEKSIWQTMRRSIWTSVSTLMVLIALAIFWTWILKTFAITIWFWVLVGTYSSIFLAAPIVHILKSKLKVI